MVANRVLLTGDRPVLLHRLRRLLESAGFDVTASLDRGEAVALLGGCQHDIVLSDASSPEGIGYELCRMVRADSVLSSMPVVLLSSPGDLDAVLQSLEVGASSVIAETPYEDALLYSLASIRESLERHGSSFGSFGAEVFANGRRYHLNPPGLETIDLLLSTYDDALQQSLRLDVANRTVTNATTRLNTLEQSYQQLLDTNMDAIVVVDDMGVVCYANPSAQSMAPERFSEGSTFDLGIEAGERSELEFKDCTGAPIVAEMRVVKTLWEGSEARMAVLRDVTEQVRLREQLRHMSMHDELTGLLNRRGFVAMGEQQLSLARRLGRRVCLTYIDLDGMKQINDKHGHSLGDHALLDLAGLAQVCFRGSDIVARIGGDEFAIFSTFTGESNAQPMLQRLRQAMEAHSREGGRPYTLSASMGVVHSGPGDVSTLDHLMSMADSVMYEEKLAKRASEVEGLTD